MWSSETKLLCIKTELKRCTVTESLWNRYDNLAQVAGGARQAFAQSGEEGQRTGTERTVGFRCD